MKEFHLSDFNLSYPVTVGSTVNPRNQHGAKNHLVDLATEQPICPIRLRDDIQEDLGDDPLITCLACIKIASRKSEVSVGEFAKLGMLLKRVGIKLKTVEEKAPDFLEGLDVPMDADAFMRLGVDVLSRVAGLKSKTQ